MGVNEIKLNGVTLMSVREDSVAEDNLLLNETATNNAGEKIKGELDPVTEEELDEVKEQLNELSDDVYKVSDEEGEIEETDYIPFNDISDVEKPKKKALLSSIIDKIKSAFLPKTWGHVELIQSSDVLAIKDKEVDATASDNNITANHYPSSNKILDNNGKTITSFESIVQTDGTIKAKVYSRNYDTNGNFLGENYITVNKEKSGNSSYGVADKRAFRKAIETIDQMGTEIPSNADLNNYTTAGVYYVLNATVASTISNIPSADAGKLIVLDRDTGARLFQVYIISRSYIYIRNMGNNSVWDEWLKLASIDDITPANVGNGYAEATVSGSAITATITGFKLRAGVIVALKITTTTSSACTLNINNTGAKTVTLWNNENPSVGKPIRYGINLFIYDGTYYRCIGFDRTPMVGIQNYVADTSGNELIEWGYGSNKAQLKYNIGANKLLWNYYKNSAWRGDVVLADYDDLVTQMGTQIPSNSDLNDYKSVGVYRVQDGTTASTISNMPIQVSGKLIVMALTNTSSWNTQIYIPNNDDGLYRRRQGSSGDWEDWVEYANTNQIIKTSSNLENITSLDDIPINTAGRITFTSDSGLSPLESMAIRDFHYICVARNNSCRVLTLTRYNNTFVNSSSKWERVDNGSGWTPYWVDYTPRGTYVGTCTTAGGTKDKIATVDSDFKLIKGVRVAIKFSNNNTYSNVTTSPITLNVNGTGAKNIWYNTTHSGAGNTGTSNNAYGFANRYNYYIYDGTYWVWDSKSSDDNNTYSNQSLGNGYGTCTTAEATTAKAVTLSGYNLTINGYVSVKFTNAVPANSTMNINSKGAKEIWHRGAKITANKIKAGDLATFVYDGTRYHLVANDRYIT